MRYFLIAGEASGDLHAAHLIRALKARDADAEFRGVGGDLMAAEGMELMRHYRDLAYMGFVDVALHLPAILKAMRSCRSAIASYRPDCLILVDYPGFNLKIAKWVRERSICPIYYYIAPKIWAWKEGRIRALRRDIDHILSILPFEVDYFRDRHDYVVDYVGNPSYDEIEMFRVSYGETRSEFCTRRGWGDRREIIAVLPGSRRAEIADNLPRMLAAAAQVADSDRHRVVVAGAPGIADEIYARYLPPPAAGISVDVVRDETYALLSHAAAALVTSGTATLETALFGVPQVVCYNLRGGAFTRFLRPYFLKCPYISLVNLIADREVVPELIADHTRPVHIAAHLAPLLSDSEARRAQLDGYARMRARLGTTGAPNHAAERIRAWLQDRK